MAYVGYFGVELCDRHYPVLNLKVYHYGNRELVRWCRSVDCDYCWDIEVGAVRDAWGPNWRRVE